MCYRFSRSTFDGDLLIGLRGHLRHLPDESHDLPDRCIIECLAPRGHGAHLDAVLDDPECPSAVTQVFLRKIRRVRVEPRPDLRLRHPWRQVTADTKRCIVFRPGCDPPEI